ncbi:MAG: beta-lactamase domain-containing protein [Anaerolineaceae bacterium]|nr:MAG: beta-lactamase domain-containing protein [Anaerolineaceae bacterium]
MTIATIDLNFLDRTGDIAAYLIPHAGGAALVDPGPESTLPALTAALGEHGLTPRDVTHVLLTHVHLDHAGAAGWFASQGAKVYVHPAGAPHMLNPEKLVASASRLYGEYMDRLWGAMKPVPAARLVEVRDEAEIAAGDLRIRALYTSGHAEHHISYLCENVLFSGDVGGVRFGQHAYVRLPFVPPETHLAKWRASLERMKASGCTRIAPTHFGIYNDAVSHLTLAARFLDDVEAWLEQNMPGIPDSDTLTLRYTEFLRAHGLAAGLDDAARKAYDVGNPISFAASGLFRYWQKVRNGT